MTAGSASPPRTFAQWRDALCEGERHVPADRARQMAGGQVPPTAAGAVMELTAQYCEGEINRRARRLRYDLEECAADGDAVMLACTRFSRGCEGLLFFVDVEGMPAEPSRQLEEQIRGYMTETLGSIASDAANLSGDVAYCLQRLERRWADG